ncbi:hypothetical protein CA51_46270 [Rosistilla oblonga]|uniref:hypothetical protein n=1 Tax=Rosistilla oblonga TaxID=2527990 RepID=UPI00118D3653|nr:hypothetical protein [Rosistilla oblonga]QDV14717.1 hypothetical protein CA51_46270 [Rosistilla oblonga]
MIFSLLNIRTRLIATLVAIAVCNVSQSQAGIITANLTTLDPILSGQTVNFDIDLLSVALPNPTDSIISVTLDFTASDAALTGAGFDFSGFSFVADPGLMGELGFSFDPDVSDDGRVTLDADVPPFGTDSGIPNGTGFTRLGILSVVAPALAGDYSVNFSVDSFDPIFGTSLLLDDFFTTLAPSVQGATFTVEPSTSAIVPEPTSLMIFGCISVSLMFRSRNTRRGQAHRITSLVPMPSENLSQIAYTTRH